MFLSRVRADGGMMDRSPWGSFWFTPLGSMTRTGVRVTPVSALGLPVVYSCIRVLAESFAVMPFTLYQPKTGGGRTKNTKHWLYRLFAKSPNRFQTPYEWRLMLQGHLALRGNAFCQITANGKGEIVELLPLHPDRMTVELLDAAGNYRYRYVDANNQTYYFARNEIWHLRGQSDDSYLGLSPITLAREAIGEGLSIQAYSARFFANDAKPGGGWIEYPGQFATTEAKKTFRDSWQQMQGGANGGKVAVLDRGMKFHELGLNNKEAQFIEARAAKKSEIASIWRIPPHKVGDLSEATFSNIEQQSIEFWTDTMLPYAELWESSIEYFLLGADEPMGLEPEFDMRRMMRGDSVARGTYYTSGINAGWLTRNEAREQEGFDPIDGLDEPLRPLNMVEESDAAADELVEGDSGADDGSADARRARRRSRKAAAKKAMRESAVTRVDALLLSAAERLARRIMKEGKAPEASLVAATLAVPLSAAQEWVTAHAALSEVGENQLIASLVALGKSV
jgi:HK97 family phage portal protein